MTEREIMICPKCKGNGFMECPKCGGSGYNHLDGGQCDKCCGSGEVDCLKCEESPKIGYVYKDNFDNF